MFGSAARVVIIDRRQIIGLAVAALSFTIAGCGTPSPDRIALGTGLDGGLFHEFGNALAEAAELSSGVRITPVPTPGSVKNLELLEEGRVDAALALGDTTISYRTRGLAVGRLYESYIHIAVHTDSPVRQLGDLRGTRVDLGVAGSGAAETAERLLRAAGLEPGTDFTASHRELPHALRAFRSGEVDAVIWGAGLPTPGLGVPALFRMLDLGEWVEPMRRRFGFHYDRVTVPEHTYPGIPAFETIGVPVVLLVTPHAPDDTVVALAELLMHHSHALVPEQTHGFQFFDRHWLVSTGTIPLHPAAADYYSGQRR